MRRQLRHIDAGAAQVLRVADAGFRHTDGETALGHIVRARHQSCLDCLQAHRVDLFFEFDIDRGIAVFQVVDEAQVFAARQTARRDAHQHHGVAGPLDVLRDVVLGLLDQPHHSDHRCRVDGSLRVLIVEAHIAADHGRVQGAAGRRESFDALLELPVILGLHGVAEVEAVGDCERPAAGANDVAGRLGHGEHGALVRVQVTIAAVAVDAEGERLAGSRDGDDGRIRSRAHQHRRLVLEGETPVGGCFAGDRRGIEQRQQHGIAVPGLGDLVKRQALGLPQPGGFLGRSIIKRRIFGQRLHRHFGHDLAVLLDAEHAVRRDRADPGDRNAPLPEDGDRLVFPSFLEDREHPLLGFAEQDFIGRHFRLALRDQRHIELDPRAATRRRLAGRANQPGGPHVLHPGHQSFPDQLKARLAQAFAKLGVADRDRTRGRCRLVGDFL